MKTIFLECPDELHERLQDFVRSGWGSDTQQTLIEALRRFLDSHQPDIIETQIKEDVEWGLRGNE